MPNTKHLAASPFVTASVVEDLASFPESEPTSLDALFTPALPEADASRFIPARGLLAAWPRVRR